MLLGRIRKIDPLLASLTEECRDIILSDDSPHQKAVDIVLRLVGEKNVDPTQALRLAFLVMTNSVVTDEGIEEVGVSREGFLYFYPSASIRVGGGTEVAFVYVLLLLVRHLLKAKRFKGGKKYLGEVLRNIDKMKQLGGLQAPIHPRALKEFVERTPILIISRPVEPGRSSRFLHVRNALALFINDAVVQKSKKLLRIIPRLKRIPGEVVRELEEVMSGVVEGLQHGEGEAEWELPNIAQKITLGRPFLGVEGLGSYLRDLF